MLSQPVLSVFDVTELPFVVVRNEAIVSGYAPRWIDDMQMLLRIGTPFVMIFPAGRPEETHEDRKQRGLWLKENRDALAAVCRALITIEPDASERAAAQATAPGIEKAFGVPVDVVASPDEARQVARRRMTETV
ncbi:hypothetical protein [Burkholderia plantarii]|uniref:hypothetical protein n=1 Tax=Burkholderia plantarii TaxID=41899 RepID=UPI0018DC960E|nr:hypothetical protein [Burkholderia plantarii]MBI0328016.1 hypothetical protein [Burkholderia plantarii]